MPRKRPDRIAHCYFLVTDHYIRMTERHLRPEELRKWCVDAYKRQPTTMVSKTDLSVHLTTMPIMGPKITKFRKCSFVVHGRALKPEPNRPPCGGLFQKSDSDRLTGFVFVSLPFANALANALYAGRQLMLHTSGEELYYGKAAIHAVEWYDTHPEALEMDGVELPNLAMANS